MVIYVNNHRLITEEDEYFDHQNLADGSSDFSGTWSAKGGKLNSTDLLGNSAYQCSQKWTGITTNVYVTEGVITWSEYVKLNYSKGYENSLGVYYLDKNELGGTWEGQALYGMIDNNKISASAQMPFVLNDTNWHRVSVTFRVTKPGITNIRVESSLDNIFWVASPKVERGSIVTSWTYSQNDIRNLRTRIIALENQNGGVNSLLTAFYPPMMEVA